jgi:hypothetical protein
MLKFKVLRNRVIDETYHKRHSPLLIVLLTDMYVHCVCVERIKA